MTYQKFAEKYAGWMAKVITGKGMPYDSVIGRIIGYNPDYCCVSLEVDKDVSPQGLYGTIATTDYDLITNSYLFFQPSFLQLIQPPIQSQVLPDDCHTCGAIGEEKCKEGCPNK